MQRRIITILILLLTCTDFLINASTTDHSDFSQVNRFMSEKKFKEAIPLLKAIIEKDPLNPDANFKLGICYYFFPDRKNLALEYFRNAMGNINQNYKFSNKDNTGTVPVDIYFFIAESFLNNYMPDSALYYYIKYKNRVNQESPFNLDKRINWCVNAMKEMSTPLNVNINNLGNSINSKYIERNPVITLDNSVLFFSSARPVATTDKVQNDTLNNEPDGNIYYAIKMPSGKWSKPVYFNHNTSKDEFPACLSADGKMLILTRKTRDNYDLFYSLFEKGEWTKPVSMGGSINSSGNEKEASLSQDGKILYFSSDRKGGYGNYDIYVSNKMSDGHWTNPANLGKTINTPDNEASPFIYPDGKILYFSSDGHMEESMGGYDIYYSTKNDNDTWSFPKHLKYPVNTTRDDLNYQIASGGRRYCTSLTDFNSFDIVEIAGHQDDANDFSQGTGRSNLFSELNVTEVMEVQKEVEKEVQVSDVVEVKTEVEKEVPVVETIEVEKNNPQNYSLESVNLEKIDSTQRELLIKKVKDYYSKTIGTDKSVIFKTIFFSFNSAELLMLSKNELRVLVEYLNENPTVKVEVIGHTDIVGDWDVNLNVSRDRAGSVYQFLLENHIAHNRIIYYGKGSAAPIASNTTIDGRAKNRRVEILLLK